MIERIRKMKDQGGFTMIEMAVVLVIIGMILAAVMSGKDIIDNGKARQFSQFVKSWENAVWQFRDQKGYFPGDGAPGDISTTAVNGRILENFMDTVNGVIADETATTRLSGVYLTQMYIDDTPKDVINIGSHRFWVKLGNDKGLLPGNNANVGTDDGLGPARAPDATTDDPDKNIMIVCGSEQCDIPLHQETVAWFEAFDGFVDGEQDAAGGRVRALTNTLATGHTCIAAAANATPYFISTAILAKKKRSGVLTTNELNGCVNEVATVVAAAGTSQAFNTNHFGLVYYFDRAP